MPLLRNFGDILFSYFLAKSEFETPEANDAVKQYDGICKIFIPWRESEIFEHGLILDFRIFRGQGVGAVSKMKFL